MAVDQEKDGEKPLPESDEETRRDADGAAEAEPSTAARDAEAEEAAGAEPSAAARDAEAEEAEGEASDSTEADDTPPGDPGSATPGSGGGTKDPGGAGAPAWVVPLYLGGLVLLYVGERILSTFEGLHWMVSGLGMTGVLAATVVRFLPSSQAGGDRGRIERLLGILSLVGLLAVGVYLLSTEGGLDKLGLAQADDEVRDEVSTLLTIGWVTMIVTSVVPMLFAEAALYPMRNAERLESRRVSAAAVSGLVLSMAVVYGSLLVYAADGTEARVDYSYFKTSEPSDSTKKLVEGLGQSIKVTAFFPEVSPVRREVEGYLKALAAGVPTLEIEIADRYLVPKRAEELKVVRDGILVIQKGEAKRTVYIGTDMKEAQAKLKTLDRDFQERLYKLLRSRRTVYLTVGHGEINDDQRGVVTAERSGKLIKKLLEKQHYLVKELGLSQGLASDVPEDADIVMVLGPTQPLAPEELASLKRYADRGGKLLVALDPDAITTQDLAQGSGTDIQPASLGQGGAKQGTAEAPGASSEDVTAEEGAKPETGEATADSTRSGLEALAGILGLQFDPTILANDKQYVRRRFNDSDRTWLVTNRFSSHASVSTLSRNSSRAAVLMAGTGALEKRPDSTEKVDVAVRALASTFADQNRNYRQDEGEKQAGFGLAVAVSKPIATTTPVPEQPKEASDDKKIPDVPTPDEMRAFVLADADALTDVVLANFMTNQLLVVDALRWLGGEESFAGEVNVEEDVRIEHTQQKDLVWFYSTIFGVPALVLALGLTYSRRSRRPEGGKS